MSPSDFDYDWLVVGSGFGGSVSALRLAEKGHRVAVLEKGRRYADADLPESTSDRRSFLWAPALGWRGIVRLRLFKDLFTPTQTVDDDTTIEFLTYGRNADARPRESSTRTSESTATGTCWSATVPRCRRTPA